MPIAHLGIYTKDLEKLSTFYDAALKPLGCRRSVTLMDGAVLGYGPPRSAPDFWLSGLPWVVPADFEGKSVGEWEPLHVAFSAKTRNQVRAFYDAAIAAGGKCNGPPGPRPQYFFTYYGAFVHDPEGRNIEAVCLAPAFWAEEWGWKGWLAISTVLVVGGGYVWQSYMM